MFSDNSLGISVEDYADSAKSLIRKNSAMEFRPETSRAKICHGDLTEHLRRNFRYRFHTHIQKIPGNAGKSACSLFH
jgi:hypothetical protein